MRYRRLITENGDQVLIRDEPSEGITLGVHFDDVEITTVQPVSQMTIADLETVVAVLDPENDTISISMNQQTPAVETREI